MGRATRSPSVTPTRFIRLRTLSPPAHSRVFLLVERLTSLPQFGAPQPQQSAHRETNSLFLRFYTNRTSLSPRTLLCALLGDPRVNPSPYPPCQHAPLPGVSAQEMDIFFCTLSRIGASYLPSMPFFTAYSQLGLFSALSPTVHRVSRHTYS